MLEELHILPDIHKKKCTDLIEAKLGPKVSGADMRATVITMYQLLKNENAPQQVLDLLETIVRISKILYMDDQRRTPLYNSTWLHMELCKVLFPHPKKITRRKFFGVYIHALTSHDPIQFEIVSQKAANSEDQERLFGQARRAAQATSNRHAQNVIIPM